jgi:hypothetical protein
MLARLSMCGEKAASDKISIKRAAFAAFLWPGTHTPPSRRLEVG